MIGRQTEGSLGSHGHGGLAEADVVGVATSVTRTSDAWVLPSEIPALATAAGAGPGLRQAQMLYRFAGASTGNAQRSAPGSPGARRAAARRAAGTAPAGRAPGRAGRVAPWVPFIVAFGVLALVISVLIVVNVVGGAVLAGTTRIGVLKSVGFTPAQVTACYVLMVRCPRCPAALPGWWAGTCWPSRCSARTRRSTGSACSVSRSGPMRLCRWRSWLLTAAGAVPPALRAGRMSAVAAIATGRAPRPAHGYLAHRALARLTMLPRAVTLGLAAPSARPAGRW